MCVGGCRLKPGLSWEFVSGGTRSGGGRHLAQVTFTFATHCFRGWPGTQTAPGILDGVCGDLAFLGCTVDILGVGKSVLTALVREERKKKYLGLPGPRFFGSPSGLVALCRQTVQKLPGKLLSELWGRVGTDIGALCQVLFVPGITSSDYCPTTSL